MAKVTRTLTELTDDIDGGEAEETIAFSLDGAAYEIDLNAENATALRAAFATYVGHGRKMGRGPAAARRPAGSPRPRAAAGGKTAEIRAWAREQGLTVNERGRMAADIVDKYEAAH